MRIGKLDVLCFRRPQAGGVAAVGDSVTSGHSRPDRWLLAPDSWLSWAVSGPARVRYGYNAAVPNQTTSKVWEQLPRALAYQPRIVAIMTGTNDVFEDYPLDQPLDLIHDMAWRAREAGAIPVLCTLPPYKAACERVYLLNRALRSLARVMEVPLIDFHAVITDGQGFKDGLSDDGLHPNERGSRVMGELAAPSLAVLLNC